MLRRQLDGRLMTSANRLGRSIEQPSASQLSRLRLAVQDALGQPPAKGRASLNSYLESIESRQTARKQFVGDQVGSQSLMDRLRFRVQDESDIWRELEFDSATIPKVGGIPGELTPELAYEYNLRLIDGALARAAKTKRKREEE